jgi:hypothetical protein
MPITKQNALTRMSLFEVNLPFGAKTKIALTLEVNKHNVQTAFRGMAGEELTIKVYRTAKKLYPKETILKRSNTQKRKR